MILRTNLLPLSRNLLSTFVVGCLLLGASSAWASSSYVPDTLSKMDACGFTNYSSCLQLQHPSRVSEYERWQFRGSICTEVMHRTGNPVAYNQADANEASTQLASTDCDKQVNVARTGLASQSSEGWGGGAQRAIDGNTSGAWDDGSVTHTNGANSGWQVDLVHAHYITGIRIHNRTDCCSERLTNFSVDIIADDGKTLKKRLGPFNNPGAVFDVPGVGNTQARIVRIHMPGPYLSLAEVQVFGKRDNRCADVTGGHNMTEACAEMMWKEAGCSTDISHSAWIQWARNMNLSMADMKHDFDLWASMMDDAHVYGCQSGAQLQMIAEDKGYSLTANVSADASAHVYVEGDLVKVEAAASASASLGSTIDLGNGVVLSSELKAEANANASVCAGLNFKECAGVYAEASASAGISAETNLDSDSVAGKINVCAKSMAEVGASAEGGAVIDGNGAKGGAGFEAGAKVGAEGCTGITGELGNLGGKAGVSIGPSVSGGIQMSFNFDGCTFSTSFDGEAHLLVGVKFEASGGVNLCAVGEKVAQLASDLWYDVAGGAAIEEWTVGAYQDVAAWTSGAAADIVVFAEQCDNGSDGCSVVRWSVTAAGDIADWTGTAAGDVADWTGTAAGDVADWTKTAAGDTAGWTTAAAGDVADWTEGAGASIGGFCSSWF
jgi:hypothetical protein